MHWQHNNDILWNVRRYEPATGLYMYLYRDYDAPSGRWSSRDPIEERGGTNLYGFVGNDGVGRIDYLGLTFIFNVRRMPMNEIFEKYGGNYAYTGSVDGSSIAKPIVQSPTLDYIYESPDRMCAKVVKANDIIVHVLMVLPSTNVIPYRGGVTENGMFYLMKHEFNRGKVYRMAYDKYIAPVALRGNIALKCGTVKRSSPGLAKLLLQNYLTKVRTQALAAYEEYVDREQRLIGSDNSQNNWIMDGNLYHEAKKLHNPQPPPGVLWEFCPY